MKKLALALTALAIGPVSASAADLAPRYTKAPAPVVAVANWTGCYIGGGGGYGMWNQENTVFDDTVTPRTAISGTATTGGRGYFGTVQGGCDYQFGLAGQQFVVGAFGDYDLASMKGQLNLALLPLFGEEKLSSEWAAGGRIGWLVTPSLLTYFTGGYTEARFDRVNLAIVAPPLFQPIAYANAHTYKGWFLGAGDEYALSFAPGLFWKTEYRLSHFDKAVNTVFDTNNALAGFSTDSEKWVHTVRSELVYRFNWGGSAPDLTPRYTKAPAPVANWTGCYVGAGGGYGLWNQENTIFDDTVTPRAAATGTSTAGGRGYFGTVQGGCDYQFAAGSAQFVAGAFGDYDFAGMKGHMMTPGDPLYADEKLSSQWAAGGRVGWLATPTLLTYLSGGYNAAQFDRLNFAIISPPFPTQPAGVHVNGRTYNGWFLGAGDEYAVGFLPGLFWKTEYRFSHLDKATNTVLADTTNVSVGNSIDSEKWTHTVRSELVYRFNWGGPVVAKY